MRACGLLLVGAALASAAPFDVKGYGAKGDGHALDTSAIRTGTTA
jgi:polygalacturonase